MPTYITDAASTGLVQSTQLVVDMAEKVFYLEPSANPLTRLMTLVKKNIRTVSNPRYDILEQELMAASTTTNTVTNTATSIVCTTDGGDIFNVNDIAKNPRTAEVVLITAISTDTLTVTRSFGSTDAAAFNTGDTLLRIGNAYTEGDGAEAPNVRQLDTSFNYTMISRTPFAVTGTMMATKSYSGPELVRLRKEAGVEHAVGIERSILFAERDGLNLTAANPRRSTRGLVASITTNSYAAGGALTEDEFEQSVLETAFRYGSDQKCLLASARLVSVIDGWGRDRLRGDEAMSGKLGLKVMQYNSTHGDLKVIKHKLLEGSIYEGYGIIVDPAHAQYVVLKGRNTQLRRNIHTPGDDEVKEEYLTEFGFQLTNEKTCMLLTGVTS